MKGVCLSCFVYTEPLVQSTHIHGRYSFTLDFSLGKRSEAVDLLS